MANDGHTIFISDQGPVTLVFFQTRNQGPTGLEADVVAAVRMHSLDLKEAEKRIKSHLLIPRLPPNQKLPRRKRLLIIRH
jgi:hypothetical protein